jgi:hypothetical protein
MSEPDSPRWLSEFNDELRREVEVRPAWRARLLADVARSPRPSASGDVDGLIEAPVESLHVDSGGRPRRTITLSPIAGLAAAVLFIVLGAGVTYVFVNRPAKTGVGTVASAPSRAGTPALPASDPVASTSREVVEFELSAPRASRVMLVGSFNEWNPTATPLERDPTTGKWTVAVRLPPGRHVYAFVVDGDVTADPAAPRAADDDYGSTNSVVLVSSPRT